MRRCVYNLFFVFFLLNSSVCYSASLPPRGAIKLTSDKIFQQGDYYCGLIKNKWIPGRIVTKYFFYSLTAEKSNLSIAFKKSSGKAKKKYLSKIAKLQSQIADRGPQCASGPSVPTPIPTITPEKQPLIFDLTNAIGLALKDPEASSLAAVDNSSHDIQASNSSSNLQKVNINGEASESTKSGKALVSKIHITSNKKLYVLFKEKTNLEDTSSAGKCLLAYVNPTSGEPTCVESEFNTLGGLTDESSGRGLQNSFAQFDDAGNIYYVGTGSNGTVRLRKSSGTTYTDLVDDNISLTNFLVLGDGTVIISGRTLSTNSRWVRRILPSGQISNLLTAVNLEFLKVFPDNNVYMGFYGPSDVKRYLPTTDSMDTSPWIGLASYGATNPIDGLCAYPNSSLYPTFCGYLGGFVKGIYNLTSGKVYSIVGIDSEGTLVQYYPTVDIKPTAVKKISASQKIANYIFLSGLNASNKNILTLYNTETDTEVQLVGPENEIEIYHINYISDSNKVMFDGLRFSDNKYVIGFVNINTLSLDVGDLRTTKFNDFQTF